MREHLYRIRVKNLLLVISELVRRQLLSQWHFTFLPFPIYIFATCFENFTGNLIFVIPDYANTGEK